MRMSICLNAEAEEYRMFRVSLPDYFAPRCGLEFDASPADLRQWREEINRFLITLRDLSRIADYFDVSLDYLTGRSDYTKPLEVA